MKNFLTKVVTFHARVFSEPTGQPSFGRWATGLVVLTCCFAILFLTIRNKQVPPLEGIAWFLTTSAGSLYGVNKVATAWERNRVDANGRAEADEKTADIRR